MKKLHFLLRRTCSEFCNLTVARRFSVFLPLLVLVFVLFPFSSSGLQDFTLPFSGSTAGQSSTLLPDGRWLLSGGEGLDGSPSPAVSILDPATGQSFSLGSLNRARAWHSATMLPDGTVFIFGGVGADGKVVEDAEIFDPETQTFQILPPTGLTARARHTATLLTDGLVLIAGGLSADGKALDNAELWDFQDGISVRMAATLSDARYNHTATLLADGRVLLAGGRDKHGDALDNGDLFDPSTETFTAVTAAEIQNLKTESPSPEVIASLPTNGSVDIALDSIIAVRFSTALRVETLNSDTIILSGPNGIEKAQVVPAEGGILAFVTPETLLTSGATYTVTLNGPIDRNGFLLPVTSFSFTTGSSGAETSPSSTGTTPGSSPTPSTTQDANSGANDDDGFVWKGELRDGKPHSSWQDLPPLQAKAGVTALAGQVLDLKGEPLANVTLEMEYGSKEIKTKTDETGRFLIENIEAGWSELLIDGRVGHNPNSGVEDPKWGYGIFEYGLQITEGQTNVLPFTIWLPKIDVANTVTIPSPTTSEIVVTTPKIPGLEAHIPPGTVIYDYDWKVADEINITRMPQDRTPFPLPKGVVTPALFTIQPGGAYVRRSAGVRLVYPNFSDKPLIPGTRFNFWHYDPGYEGWYIYGLGTVTEDGKQIVPDPGVSIREFTGAMVEPPSFGPTDDTKQCKGADPVDLCTGLFEHANVDLNLPDVMPLVLTRSYRTRDTFSRAFGIGTTHSFDHFLVGDTSPYTFIDLILSDGMRIHYTRIDGGNGNDFTVAVYEHTSTPTRFHKSRISWNGSGWDLKLKDGMLYKFRDGFGATRPGHGGVIRVQDRNGNAHEITRDGNGNVTKVTSFPSGRWIEFINDTTNNRITQAKDNTGRIVSYTYHPTGQLHTVTDPNGGIWEYTYDALSRMLTIKNPRNITVVSNDEFDAAGKVKKQTLSDGGVYTANYTLDGNGKTIQTDVTDPRNIVRRVMFNADGYNLSEIRGLGIPEEQTTTYERQPGTNLLLSATDALGRKTAYTYDTMGNVLTVTRLADTLDAVTTTFTYEPIFNQLKTITDPLTHTTTFDYDTQGNLTTLTDALNKTTTITPNSAGQPISIEDPLHHITQFTYNAGDLATITDPLGNLTTRFTDAAGRLRSVTNPLGNLTLYDYDSLNRLTKVTDPLQGQTQLEYDANGNLKKVTDARSKITEYTYKTNVDRRDTRIDPLLHVETYNTYDGNGNLTQFTDRKGQVTTYEYDALNRRKKVTYVVDSSTTEYVYDAGNRLRQIIDSNSGTITRDYDGLDRLTLETTPQGSVSYTYDNAGRRTSMTVAGQPTVTYPVYDDANRLKQITQGTSNVLFDYDDTGRRTTLTLPNGIQVQYGYDNASRVTGITYKLGVTVLGDLTYEYDKTGNRTKVGGTWARTGIPQAVGVTNYDDANRQLTFGDKTLMYDNNGNLTSILDGNGTSLYNWNARNQLSTLSGPALSANFAYDGLGRREQKTVNGSLTEFLFDGVNPAQESSGTAVLANILSGIGIDEFLLRTDVATGITSEFLSDALGSPVALTDSNGTIQNAYVYDPFGGTTISGSPNSNPLQFTGRENDGTGLYYYRARYYDTEMQRFIAEDPKEFRGGDINLYSYVKNNPILLKDPLGLSCICGEKLNVLFSVGWSAGWRASELADEAKQKTNHWSGLSGRHDGPADAFRHCYWTCRMTQELGPEAAKKIGDNHEECWPNPWQEHVMDYYNNALGRMFGIHTGVNCGDACLRAVISGQTMNGPPPAREY